VLSKLGYCSRSQGFEVVRARRVQVNGIVRTDPEFAVDMARDRITVDGREVRGGRLVYLMLNKPRGLVTTREDEQGRPTVYSCLEGHALPWVAPVGRLDKASEGLILFTSDSAWANHLLAPESHVIKTYHVQVDCLADEALCERLVRGTSQSETIEVLSAKNVSVLRTGGKHSWLQIILDEGKNRHIRRLLEASRVGVLRLIRVAIGNLQLGSLPKGRFRHLTETEVKQLGGR
jgi:23S rRNA pseudouridine2605 synthase